MQPPKFRIFLAISCSFWFGCKEPDQLPPNYQLIRKKEPVSESFNVTYKLYENNLQRAIFTAPNVKELFVNDTTEETFTLAEKSFKLEFLDSLGRPESKLTAQKAQLFPKRNYAIVTGNVVLVNQKGEKLETEKLHWHQPLNRLSTAGFVKITTNDEIILGDSLVANTKFSQYKIFKIKGVFSLKE